MRLAKELTPSPPIFYESKLSLTIAPLAFSIFHQFLLSSLVFLHLCQSSVCHDWRCKARKPTCDGLSSALRTLVLCFSGNSESFCIVIFTSLTAHFETTVGPCDHPQVVFVESLPLFHIVIQRVLKCFSVLSSFYRISKMVSAKNQDL